MTYSIDQAPRRIIAVHGSASTGAQWRRLKRDSPCGLVVLTPDRPGYGDAERQTRCSAEALLDVIGDAGRPIHLVGHSYGGALVLNLAAHRPERVASLTLIEPTAFHLLRDRGGVEDLLGFATIQRLASTFAEGAPEERPEAAIAGFVDFWNGAGAWDRMKPDLHSLLLQQKDAVARDFKEALAETWPVERCANITCPTLVIRGAASPAPARRVANLVAAAIPSARAVEIAGAGHMAPVTHVAIVN